MKTLPAIYLFATICIALGTTQSFAQPGNDLIEDAFDIGYGYIPYIEEDVEFSSATNLNDGTPASGCQVSQSGVWYKFNATKTGEVAAGIINPSGATVIFYEGPYDATSGMELIYVDQTSNPCAAGQIATIETTPGTTYYIYMRNIVDSDVYIDAEDAFLVPENDLIENAINLNGLEDYFENDIHFNVATVTNDSGQSGCPLPLDVKAIWYKFTAQTDGQVVAGISNPPSDSGVIFYTAANENATTGSDLTWVNQQTNPCGVNNLSSINAVNGTTYYLMATTFLAYADVSINLSGILGTNESKLENFSYYPNPVVETLHLNAKSVIDTVTIHTLSGQRIQTEMPGTDITNIDLSMLATGIYIMSVTSEGITANYKVVKK